MKYRLSNQLGFTILEISLASVVVFLVTSIGLYTVNRVQSSQNDRTDSTEQLPKDQKSELKAESEQSKAETVKVPAEQPAVTEKPKTTESKNDAKKTEADYKSLAISLADAQIQADPVVFAASWSGSYSGVCYLTVKNLTTLKYVSKEMSVNGSSCNFSVAKAELGTGDFKYYVTFKNTEHTVKGQSDYKTFNL